MKKIPYLVVIAVFVVIALVASFLMSMHEEQDPDDEMIGTYDASVIYWAAYDLDGNPEVMELSFLEDAFKVFAIDSTAADCDFMGQRIIANHDGQRHTISFCWPMDDSNGIQGEFVAWWNGVGFDLYFLYTEDGEVGGFYMYLTKDGSKEGFDEDDDYQWAVLKEGESYESYEMYSVKEGVKTEYPAGASFEVTKVEKGFVFVTTYGTEEIKYIGVTEYFDFMRLYAVLEDGTVVRDNILELQDVFYIYSTSFDTNNVPTTFVVKYAKSRHAMETPLELTPGMVFKGKQTYVIGSIDNRIESDISIAVTSVVDNVVTFSVSFPTGVATWTGVVFQDNSGYIISTNLISQFLENGKEYVGHYDLDMNGSVMAIYGSILGPDVTGNGLAVLLLQDE